MNNIFILFFVICIQAVYAEDVKLYSQAEFDEKLKTTLKEEVTKIKQKGVVEITQELIEKEQLIKKSQHELDKKMESYQAMLLDFNKKVTDFDASRAQFISCKLEKENEKKARIDKLVNMVSGMKPEKAANLLATQDAEISVEIIAQIDPVKASKIFNLMDKEKSATLQKQYLNMKR
jgi:flagellar motility protein MotE (MotC chaperone)